MDGDPTDLQTLSSINSGWTEIFQNWYSEHDPPHDFELTHARQTLGPNHPTTRELEERAERRDRLAKLNRRTAVVLMQAYFAFAPFLVSPTLPEPQIKRPAFLQHQMRGARTIHRAVAADAQLWSLLQPPHDAARRMALTWRMVRRST